MRPGRPQRGRWYPRALLAGALGLALTACGAGTSGEDWVVPSSGALAPRGAAAGTADRLTLLLVALGTLAYVLTLVVLGVAMWRRRRGEDGTVDETAVEVTLEGDARAERRFLLGGGLLLPAIILVPVLVATVGSIAVHPRGGDEVIDVVGRRWWWEVRYPDQGFTTASELHIPVGEDVRIRLTSEDVNHSFWVPQLSGKRDLIPGRVNELTLHADEPGIYQGACAEYCGIQHAHMYFFVIADTPEDYAAWLAREGGAAAEPQTVAQRAGQEVFEQLSCASCHAVRGTAAVGQVGPDLTHFASRRTIGAGAAPNDRGHLGGWVANPDDLKPGTTMPPVDIPPGDLSVLLDYLESLE